MFVSGLHRILEVRETAKAGETETDGIVLLSAENAGSSTILVSFTDRADISLTLTRARPHPLIQYSLPRQKLSEFLSTYPLGSLVTSSFTSGSAGDASLRITLVDEYQVAVSSGDIVDLVESGTAGAMAIGTKTLNVDTKLHGKWANSGRTFEFRPDGSYLVHDTQPFQLLSGGEVLDWGGMKFDRLSGDPIGIEGHWLSEDQIEDVLFRNDGTYTWHTQGEIPDAIGEWATNSSNLSSKELRATVSTSGNQITFDSVYGNSEVGTYVLSNGDQTLTINFNALAIEYTKE